MLLKQTKEALALGAIFVGATSYAAANGYVSDAVGYSLGAAAVVAVALRVAFIRAMGGTYVPGSLRGLPVAPTAIIDVDDHTWKMPDDAHIHHFTVGTGSEPALVIHGGPGAPPREAWTAIAGDTDLCAKFTFHFYHQRGCGLSSAGVTPAMEAAQKESFPTRIAAVCAAYGMPRQIEDLHLIRQHVAASSSSSSSKRVHIVGHSFGGFIGAMYLAELGPNPETAIASMLLVAPADILEIPNGGNDLLSTMETAMKGTDKEAGFTAFKKELFGSQLTETEEVMAKRNSGFAPYYMATAAKNEKLSAAYLARCEELMLTGSHPASGYGVTGIYFSLGMYHDYRPALPKRVASPRMPITIVQCEHDMQPAHRTHQYATLLGGDFVVMPDVLHFPHLEAPEAFRGVLRDAMLKPLAQ